MYGDGKFDTVILSGGGTKAIGSLGILHYFHENGKLDLERVIDYAGTSAGSLISILMISGYTPIEIMQEIYGVDNFFKGEYNIWDLFANYGLFNIDVPVKIVEKLVIRKFGFIPTLSELKKLTGKRLCAPAVNITDKLLVYLTPESHPHMKSTDLGKLSSKLPLIFQRVQYKGKYYEDGGLADNFPIDIVDTKGKNVLGVIVTGTDMNGAATIPFITYMYRLIMFPINVNTRLRSQNLPKNIITVSINFDDVPVIETTIEHSKKMKMFMQGYKEAEREMKIERLNMLNWSWELGENIWNIVWDENEEENGENMWDVKLGTLDLNGMPELGC